MKDALDETLILSDKYVTLMRINDFLTLLSPELSKILFQRSWLMLGLYTRRQKRCVGSYYCQRFGVNNAYIDCTPRHVVVLCSYIHS